MRVLIDVPAVTRSKSGARELAKLLPTEEEIAKLLDQTTRAFLPVSFRLQGGARITFND